MDWLGEGFVLRAIMFSVLVTIVPAIFTGILSFAGDAGPFFYPRKRLQVSNCVLAGYIM